jgi:hypothetical protein
MTATQAKTGGIAVCRIDGMIHFSPASRVG